MTKAVLRSKAMSKRMTSLRTSAVEEKRKISKKKKNIRELPFQKKNEEKNCNKKKKENK